MQEHYRLSELVGIDNHEKDSSFWQLNIVLALLGACILGIAFYALDQRDERALHNPWTYAVVTPIALTILSTLLSTVVSRLVEKSMQLAFLISVLIHLILMVYAVNIVIFSRMWPDVLESLATERQQLKRESLQAKEYVKFASNTQTGQRPDYLRPMETEHQPTEIENAISPALQLTKSSRDELVSPQPQLQKTATAHLLERPTPATTVPTISPAATSISRSEMPKPRLQPSQSPSSLPVTEPSEAQPLAAATAAARRRSASDSQMSNANTARPQTEAVSVKLPDIERSQLATENLAPSSPPSSQASLRMADVRATPRAPATSRGALQQPDVSQPQPQALAPLSQATSARKREPDVTSINLPELPAIASRTNPEVTQARRIEPRRPTSPAIPQPSAGDSRTAIARDTAGGSVGAPANSSMPIQGLADLGASTPSTSQALASPSATQRRRRTDSSRSSLAMPVIGKSASESWDGGFSLGSTGVDGRSQMRADRATSGTAAAENVADLNGMQGPIERAAIGLSGPSGAISVAAQTPMDLSESISGNGDSETDGMLSPTSRNVSRGEQLSGSQLPSPSSQGPTLSQQLAMETAIGSNAVGKLPARSTSEFANNLGNTASKESAIQRSSVAAMPSPSAVPTLPDSSPNASNDVPNFESSSSGLTRSSRQDASSAQPDTMLPLEEELGIGGLNPVLEQVGALLPRRRDLPPVLTPPQISAQRFARQDVGGELAAGRELLAPKPAFQQRLDRLRSRDSLDEAVAEPQTELAIERGLAFLAKYQRPDGSWRLQDFDTATLMRSDTAATALALLAFQGAGYTQNQFKYADTVQRAIKFLAEHQLPDGDLYIPQDPASDQNAWLYSHAIATLAICESYGMTQEAELKPIAQKAIDFMVRSQDPRRGGWRYRPVSGSDTSVSGWFMMAFKSGQLAGLNVPQEPFDKIENFLDLCQASKAQPHLYRYNPFAANTPQQRHGLEPNTVMTSVGLLMRLYLGWERDTPAMIDGSDYLLESLPRHGTRDVSLRDTYYWYYATQVIFHMGGEKWDTWHDTLYPLLISSQVTDGEFEGSWHPLEPTPDLWARYGGRLYVTTMNLLSLEVSYRHLPLYDATGAR